jgi:hypothetical protein
MNTTASTEVRCHTTTDTSGAPDVFRVRADRLADWLDKHVARYGHLVVINRARTDG